MRALSLAVVGAAHPNKRGPTRRFELQICRPGEPVELVPEPKNPKDENAIAVFSCRGIQLGYLTAERAPFIGGLMKAGHEVQCIFQELTDYGGVIRAAFDGEVPVLPPTREPQPKPGTQEADPEPDWYPDEEWPD
ncbi:HIRAN domain-containing protein [Sphingomonas sp. ACRSK]|uniref:HIRAN domain-containing protein n=1 Tax=Sphingomonas sp. ACRSK TaxID=2918213 RepID=UPI001EF4FCC7|nr:HIRAN domain-containing protein [Sphingomonas sp. ACRSK]MCG7348200.1 HIRAN domain-containing protein [Sphingomonas sp. ACRSK]